MYEQAGTFAERTTTATGDKPALPADGPAALDAALRIARVAMFQAKFATELLPALKAAARCYLQFAMHAATAAVIYAEFKESGLDIPAPAALMIAPETIGELVATMLAAGLIDRNDVLIADMPEHLKPKT